MNHSHPLKLTEPLLDGDAKGFMEKINSCCKHPEANKVIVVPDASHVFYNKHNEYASTILGITENAVGTLVG